MKELQDLYLETSQKMEKTVELLKHEFTKIRTGRASPGIVEGIKIESYGTLLPIKQVASIACPDPRLIVIRPWDSNLIPNIEKAILKSGIGFTPSNDGVAIKLPIPPLTEERRKEIVKMVHKIAEDSKIALRNIRREIISRLKEIPDISKDDKFHGEKEIQKIINKYIKEIDELVLHKEKEIMEE
jgi:ribosome recycling factor